MPKIQKLYSFVDICRAVGVDKKYAIKRLQAANAKLPLGKYIYQHVSLYDDADFNKACEFLSEFLRITV